MAVTYHDASDGVQGRNVILGQVLQLHEAAGPAAAAGRTVELEHTADPAVGADTVLDGHVLLHGGFGQLLAEEQDFADVLGR